MVGYNVRHDGSPVAPGISRIGNLRESLSAAQRNDESNQTCSNGTSQRATAHTTCTINPAGTAQTQKAKSMQRAERFLSSVTLHAKDTWGSSSMVKVAVEKVLPLLLPSCRFSVRLRRMSSMSCTRMAMTAYSLMI